MRLVPLILSLFTLPALAGMTVITLSDAAREGTSTALFANGSVSRISSSRLEMLLDQTAEAFRRTNPR